MQDICQLDQLLSVQEEASNEGWEPHWWPAGWSQAVGSPRGSQWWEAAHGAGTSPQKTSLSQQHQHCIGVPQGKEGELIIQLSFPWQFSILHDLWSYFTNFSHELCQINHFYWAKRKLVLSLSMSMSVCLTYAFMMNLECDIPATEPYLHVSVMNLSI